MAQRTRVRGPGLAANARAIVWSQAPQSTVFVCQDLSHASASGRPPQWDSEAYPSRSLSATSVYAIDDDANGSLLKAPLPRSSRSRPVK